MKVRTAIHFLSGMKIESAICKRAYFHLRSEKLDHWILVGLKCLTMSRSCYSHPMMLDTMVHVYVPQSSVR